MKTVRAWAIKGPRGATIAVGLTLRDAWARAWARGHNCSFEPGDTRYMKGSWGWRAVRVRIEEEKTDGK